MSGEMNTSLGNSFANFAVAYFLHCSKGGNPEFFDGVFEGDDALVVTDVDFDKTDFERLGFKVKLDDVDALTASFCGQIFTTSGQTIRDPLKFLESFGWTHSKIHGGEKVMQALLKAKCLSCLYENHDCPIVSEIAYQCLSTTGDVEPEFEHDGYHDTHNIPLHQQPPAIEPETRTLFASVYKISVDTQLLVEQCARAGDYDKVAEIMIPMYAERYPEVLHYAATYVEVR